MMMRDEKKTKNNIKNIIKKKEEQRTREREREREKETQQRERKSEREKMPLREEELRIENFENFFENFVIIIL